MDIRNKLVATHLFLENEYFEKYIQLINSNRQTKRQTCKTQRHHIIPVIAFKLYNWAGVNNVDNLVNLLYKDHILAHYYLALCAKETQFKYKMVSAINFILGNAVLVKLNVDELKTFTLNLEHYQQLYEDLRKHGNPIKGTTHEVSEETRQKISNANSGRIYVNKNGIVKSVSPDELNLYLENDWIRGNPNSQNRDTKKGCTIVNKNGLEKYIKKEELQDYLANGWSSGRSEEHKKAGAVGTQKFYDSLTKEEKIKKCATRTGQHWNMSEEAKNKISKANIGKKMPSSQKLKNSLNKKNTIWMTNGIKDIMIKSEREQEFVLLGYHKGRSKNRKGN